jgi:malonate transporter and related proteins
MSAFSVVLPLAILCFVGFVSAKLQIIKKPFIDQLSKLCFSWFIPLFLFYSIATSDLSAALSFGWFATFYLSVIFVFLVAYFGFYYYFKSNYSLAKATVKPKVEPATYALGGTYSNTVLIAIPMLIGLLGDEVAGQAFVIIGLHSALLFTLTEALIQKQGLKSLWLSLKNPLVFGITLGLVVNSLQISLPTIITNPLFWISQFAIPMALLSLGATMNYLPIKGSRTQALFLTIIKLLILPAITFMLGKYVFNVDATGLLILVLLTASPTGVNAFIIAYRHNSGTSVTATTVVLSTLASFITMPLWITLLK